MRKSSALIVLASLLALTACGGREQTEASRTKNAALAQPLVVNAMPGGRCFNPREYRYVAIGEDAGSCVLSMAQVPAGQPCPSRYGADFTSNGIRYCSRLADNLSSARTTTTSSTTSSSTTTSTTTSTTVAPTTTLPLGPKCAADGRCAVGNVGPGTGLVYYVDPNQPPYFNRYYEIAPPGWKAGSPGDPVLTVDEALRVVAQGISTRDGKVIATPWYSPSELDWRAPTRPELQAMYDSKVDKSMKGEYLSTSRGDLQKMIYMYLNFDTGTWRDAPATDTAKVRPVRRGPSSCALGGPCKVGDVGPMGGKVFYVTTKLNKIATVQQGCESDSNPCIYMELAPAGWFGTATDPVRQWANPKGCCQQISKANENWTGIGTGARNTDAIRLQQQSYDSAAQTAFNGNGQNADGKWVLPSTDEMREVYANRALVDAPKSGLYWTSTENMQNAAFTIDFANGDISGLSYKDGVRQHNGRFVRPVRAFAPACVSGPFATASRTASDIVQQLTKDPCLTLGN